MFSYFLKRKSIISMTSQYGWK